LSSNRVIYVFVGPTLPVREARAELDAVYLPPVAQGDVYRVARGRPWAIGIVDGYFANVPAVLHKEILWALSRGIRVYGSASMGALRAAELAPFGMVGVGQIFEQYHAGHLQDDDEVAVVHGSPDSEYVAESEAMVNVRFTLAAAAARQVIGPGVQSALEQLAKRLFYPDRAYPRLLRQGAAEGLPAAELAALEAWLPRGRVDQKRADALAMLRLMREDLAGGVARPAVPFTFARTKYWERVVQEAEQPE